MSVETMMAPPSDAIAHTIRELQQEKSRQEKTLSDLMKTRSQLEKKNDTVIRDLHVVKDKHDKLMETLKIAQHKLEQSQKELDGQQIRNKSLESKIEGLANEIDHEKERQQREVEDFQTKLSQIADKFIQARTYYMDNNLTREIAIVNKRKNAMEQKALTAEKEASKFTEQLTSLSTEKEKLIKKAELDGISLQLQHQILEMFLTEKSDVETCHNKVAEKEKEKEKQVTKQEESNEALAEEIQQIEQAMKAGEV